MAKIRRVIRKIQPPAGPAFDEQFWPVIVSLFVLGGLQAGTVLTYLRFDDPRWYANAWTWLLLIPLIVCGTIAILRRLESRAIRRGVQLSGVLCVILHWMILIVLMETTIFGRFWEDAHELAERRRPRDPLIEPRYDPVQLEPEQRREQPFQRPVEIETPQTQVDQLEQQQREPEPPSEIQPTPTPERELTADPNIVRRETPAETVPREAEQASRLRRELAAAQPRPNELISVPHEATQPSAQRSALTSQDNQLQRQAAEHQADRAPALPDVTAHAAQPSLERSRQTEQESPSPETAAAPSLRRAIAAPHTIPRTRMNAADQPAVAERTRREELQPATTLSRRQENLAPRLERTMIEPAPSPDANVRASASRREHEAAPRPTLSRTPVPIPNQRSRSTSRPDAATVANTVAPSASTPSPAEASAEPSPRTLSAVRATTAENAEPVASAPRSLAVTSPESSASVAGAEASRRSRSNLPAVPDSSTNNTSRGIAAARPSVNATASSLNAAGVASGEANAAAIAPSSSRLTRQTASGTATTTGDPSQQGPQVAPSARHVAGTRSNVSPVPTIDSSAAANATPARTARTAELAASPMNVESPAVAQGTAGDPTSNPRPARTAVTRSLAGHSGVGQSANLDRALEAANSPALIASGSARRTASTQNTPTGPALAPSAPALVRHSLAGAERPSASLRANTLENATLMGADQPAELSASASGALVRANADADPGLVTAAAGTIQVDLGPTRVVSGGGNSRAAGGGQPELNPSSEAQQLARSSAGGTLSPAITASNVDVEPVAPGGTGGGQPAPEGIAPNLAEVVRTASESTNREAASHAGMAQLAENAPSTEAIAAASATRAGSDTPAPQVASAGANAAREEDDEQERARRVARNELAGAPRTSLSVDAVVAGRALDAEREPATSSFAASDLVVGETLNRSAANEDMIAVPRTLQAAEAEAETGGGETIGLAVVRRAEAVEGARGNPEIGGGTSSPSRTSPAASFHAAINSPMLAMAGAEESAGRRSAEPVDTLGVRPAEMTTGRLGTPSVSELGARANRELVEGLADSGQLSGLSESNRSASDLNGPSLGEGEATLSPVPRSVSGRIQAPSAAVAVADLPAAPASLAVARAENREFAMGTEAGPMARQASTTVNLDVEALDGPAGLGREEAAEVGLNLRRARPESVQVQPQDARFIRQEVGGLPDFNTAAIVSTEAFRRRTSRDPSVAPGTSGSLAGRETDEAIELGLAYLARQQLPDGSWSLQATDSRAVLVTDTAATGLALLAFQGFGHTHHNNKYAATVGRGLDFLVQNQKSSGDLFIPLDDNSNNTVWLYSHGIAAIALCEAYGMTQDPQLREAAQKAIDFIVDSQEQKHGGWRYAPNLESDTSVTGWMMMALKSGELAGLEVPTETYALIERWLDLAQASRGEPHLYRYNPYAPDNDQQRHGRRASKTMTAVGLLMRLYAGWHRDQEAMIRGADYLGENLPSIGTLRNPQRDTYYWYYATQVMFHMGGDHWRQWTDRLRGLLVDGQTKSGPEAGSWDPRNPVPDEWAPHAGRLYVTTLNLLSLEVHYRHLPLYVETAK